MAAQLLTHARRAGAVVRPEMGAGVDGGHWCLWGYPRSLLSPHDFSGRCKRKNVNCHRSGYSLLIYSVQSEKLVDLEEKVKLV